MPVCRFGETVSIRVDVERRVHQLLKSEAAAKGIHLKDLLVSIVEKATDSLQGENANG